MSVRSEIRALIEEIDDLVKGRDSTIDALHLKPGKKAEKIMVGLRAWDIRIRRLKNRIRSLAVAHDIKPVPGDHKVQYKWVYSGSYTSQGFGAERYYKTALQNHIDDLEYSGIKAEPDADSGWVWAFVSDPVLDGYLLRVLDRVTKVPYPEAVRAKWARGVNPRVDNPYLPYGYEAEIGIDYSGNIINQDKFNASISR